MRGLARCLLGLSLCVALGVAQAHSADDDIDAAVVRFQGRQASVKRKPGGGFQLQGPAGTRDIPAGKLGVKTASDLFDAMFAMAQDDLTKDSVSAITDGAFDHGKSIPCACFETGQKWHYVWTRDLSYAVDLSLWRLDPERARASLRFKLSDVREPSAPQGLYVMQDTGSGGSWPISTDRIVWFMAAQHLLDDKAFADEVYRALNDTLAQDRQYTFDERLGLYRGETSFLDWRQQTYPMWAATDVTFIGQSFALSTNVLHYQALQLAATMAAQREPARAPGYRAQAAALRQAINQRFWRADRGMYMSYIGGADAAQPFDTYDLLGIALAITTGVADADRARQTLVHYPTWPSGSPVIWPERDDVPIYHNRAIWPFVSAYALRAARQVEEPERIAHEIQSLLRGAALAGSNMENFELVSQSVHVDDGEKSGPVINSPRQLWSVGAYLDMVTEGVFGLQPDGQVVPKLPVSLVPMLFGKGDRIQLQLDGSDITLVKPATLDGNLLVADNVEGDTHKIVTLKAIRVASSPLRLDAPLYIKQDASFAQRPLASSALSPSSQSLIRSSESWTWTPGTSGRFKLSADYVNKHGTIETGVTAAVYLATAACAGSKPQTMVLTMPHSEGKQQSTYGIFDAKAGKACTFTLKTGFNMSYLTHFAHFTGGEGGV
ncbi:Six-hairpin glycosidase-like protein, partial [Dyella sp.]|uniref:alpha-L-rhamnosidase-related protein n=1 Tax=Dyella sp. TaxID=1869338 RepID=UPI002ED62FD9